MRRLGDEHDERGHRVRLRGLREDERGQREEVAAARRDDRQQDGGADQEAAEGEPADLQEGAAGGERFL